MSELREAEVTEIPAEDGALELLSRHAPVLRLDRQYDYRLTSISSILENPGNLLRPRDGEVIARAGGTRR